MWGFNENSLVARVRQLGPDEAGNVLPLAGVGILMLAALIGGGMDMSRGYMAQSKLQQACDAGVLAARKAVSTNGFDSTVQAEGLKFFNVNFYDNDQKTNTTSFVTQSPDNGLTVNGTAKTKLPTVLMSLFSFKEFDLTLNCTSSMGVGNSDVTFVLDLTGSMAWTAAGSSNIKKGETSRLADLQAAMKEFYKTLKNASSGSNARIRYGFVPYSSSVNVGRLISDLDPAYLADSVDIQSRRGIAGWTVKTTNTSSGTTASSPSSWTRSTATTYNNETACWNSQNSNRTTTSWKNYGDPTEETVDSYDENNNKTTETVVTQTQNRTEWDCQQHTNGKWYWYSRTGWQKTYNGTTKVSEPKYATNTSDWKEWIYRSYPIDTSQYKRFSSVRTNTGDSGASVSSTWGGCIEERQTSPESTFSFSANGGMAPDTWDLRIDAAPDSSAESKWRPMWPQMAYYRTDSSGYYLTSDAVSKYGGQAGSYCPKAAQLLAPMTETDFNSYVNSLTASGSTYHDLGMLWGARISSPQGLWKSNVMEEPSNGATVSRHILFMTDGEMDNNVTIQTMYGIEYHDRRITTNGQKADSDSRHTSRFLALCEATKAKGIRVWVIAFGTSLTNDLKTCASENSSYSAASSTQLNAAFQQIAKQVGELRLTE